MPLRRPLQRNPGLRTEQFMVRVTPKEKATLTRYAIQHDITLSQAVRRLLNETLRQLYPEDPPVGNTRVTRTVHP